MGPRHKVRTPEEIAQRDASRNVRSERSEQVCVRLPLEVLAEIEAFAERHAKSSRVPISRATAIRLLLASGLAAERGR